MESGFEIVLFLAGLAFGSFLNVCIHRLPRDASVVRPGSRCPHCGVPVRWYDNIPLLSWLLLRGRCRDCGASISFRYFVVELLTAILFAMCGVWFGVSWLAIRFCIFCFLVVGLIFMDAETGLLPRAFTYSGIALGIATSGLAPLDSSGSGVLLRLYGIQLPTAALAVVDSVLGALVGAAFFYLAWALYYLVRHRHGLGFGDIALIAMCGAFLGLKLTLFVLFSGPVLGVMYAIVWLARSPGRKQNWLASEVPFGVFLGVSALLAVFFGEPLCRWYLGRLR